MQSNNLMKADGKMEKRQNGFSRRQDSADAAAHFLGSSLPQKKSDEDKIVLTLFGTEFTVSGKLTPDIR